MVERRDLIEKALKFSALICARLCYLSSYSIVLSSMVELLFPMHSFVDELRWIEAGFSLTNQATGKITCPCIRCYNRKYLKKATVRKNLLNHGFDRNCRLWIFLGEVDPGFASGSSESVKNMDEKIMDVNCLKPHEEPGDYTGLLKPAKGEG